MFNWTILNETLSLSFLRLIGIASHVNVSTETPFSQVTCHIPKSFPDTAMGRFFGPHIGSGSRKLWIWLPSLRLPRPSDSKNACCACSRIHRYNRLNPSSLKFLLWCDFPLCSFHSARSGWAGTSGTSRRRRRWRRCSAPGAGAAPHSPSATSSTGKEGMQQKLIIDVLIRIQMKSRVIPLYVCPRQTTYQPT